MKNTNIDVSNDCRRVGLICGVYGEYVPIGVVSRLQKVDLTFSYFLILIFILFLFIFNFSIFRTIGLRLEGIGHMVTSDGIVTTLITGLKRRK